jgi:hypothetical protein
MKWLDRLKPPRLRLRTELTGEERLRLFSAVPDTDSCLRAVIDMLEDHLEGNFTIAIDPNQAQEKRFLAMERAGITYALLQQIEEERERGKEWREKHQIQNRKNA